MKAKELTAFPVIGASNSYLPGNTGMTLRDWFAGFAMCGFTANASNHHWTTKEIASDAYAYADAMLVEREKTKR
jgi:hypothetical protein